MGTIQNTHRQVTESTRAPPMKGPVPLAKAIIAPKMPIVLSVSVLGEYPIATVHALVFSPIF